MIIRNGIRSVLRARGRTVLFTLLIFVLTLTLTLGVGMWANCASMQAQCEETYTSIALIEYMGAEYPNPDTADGYTREAAAQLDDDAIMALPGVELWERTDSTLSYVNGFTRHIGDLPYGDMVVCAAFNFYPMNEHVYTSVYATEEEIIASNGAFMIWNEEKYTYELSGLTNPDDSSLYYFWDEQADSWYTSIASQQPSGDYSCVVNRSLYSKDDVTGLTLTILPGDTGFTPESGEKYALHGRLVSGNRSGIFLQLEDFYEGCDTLPYLGVESGDDPALDGSMFESSARFYDQLNNYANLTASDDIASLEPFHQGTLYLESGRMPEAGEGGVCMMSGNMALRMGLALGETIELSRLTSEPDNRFGMDGSWEENPQTLTVVGITNTNDDYPGDLWVSAAEGGAVDQIFGYELGRLRLENASGRTTVDELEKMMPANVRVTLLDQGYSAAAQPLETIEATARAVTIASACGALAVLVLFAYLFVGRQHETVVALTSLGTSSGDIRRWLLSGVTVIAAVAASLGALAGWLSLDKIMKMALSTAQSLYSSDLRYSEAAVGLRRELTTTNTVQLWPAIASGAAVLLTALILCVVFTQLARRENTPKKGKLSVRVPKGGTSTALSGSLRFALTSARRGGWRSGVVPAATLVLSLLLGTLGMVSSGWDTQLESLYTDSVIEGQVVSTTGRSYSDMSVQSKRIGQLNSCGLLESVYVSDAWNYALPSEIPEFGSGSYSMESLNNWFAKQPKLIALNDLSAAPEFYYSGDAEVTYLDGWDESFLTDYECNPMLDNLLFPDNVQDDSYPVLVSSDFLEKRDIELGDEFYISFRYFLDGKDPYYFGVPVRAVGSFEQMTSRANMYIPLSAQFDPEWLGYDEETLAGPANRIRSDDLWNWKRVDSEAWRMSSTYFETVRFSLKSASELAAFREFLVEENFSSIGNLTRNRVTILLRDQTFTEAVGSLNRHITFGRILLPIILIVVLVMGFIISWLMINGRRMEFAVIRGFGATKMRMFLSFFLEQAILSLVGCLIAALLLIIFGGTEALPAIAVFFGCYLFGCALSVISVGRTHLMSLLSEGE